MKFYKQPFLENSVDPDNKATDKPSPLILYLLGLCYTKNMLQNSLATTCQKTYYTTVGIQ